MIATLAIGVAGAWSQPIEVTGAIDGLPAKGSLRVYLPAGYSSAPGAKKLPLVIALHGWNHSPEIFKKNGDLAALADRYGMVLAVPAMGKTVYETRFYPESRGGWSSAPGARWIAEVVLPFLRGRYAVRQDRAHTAVIGYSTGGRGALLLAEAYPLFTFAASLSGTFDLMRLNPAEGEYRIHEVVYGPRAAFPDRWQNDNCVAPVRLSKLSGTRLFAAHGAEDRVVKPDQLSALREALAGTGADAELALVPGAGHDWKFWNSQWDRVFASMHRRFQEAP